MDNFLFLVLVYTIIALVERDHGGLRVRLLELLGRLVDPLVRRLLVVVVIAIYHGHYY